MKTTTPFFTIGDDDDDGQIGTSPKKVRGMAQASLDLINEMYQVAEAAQPITGRGVGYKLFVAKLIPSMSKDDMKRVYRLLKEARERDMIPWDWIVEEGRELERRPQWDDPEQFMRTWSRGYRRDYWNDQPCRVEVWSEKGTVSGLLRPVLDEYGVGFRNVQGFSSATKVHGIAEDDDGRPLIILYVGDYDPSGLCMSERDLPKRFEKYGGDHIEIERVALRESQTAGLPSFPASDKGPKKGSKGDARYRWFVKNYGDRCWELDAMDPNDLREVVREAIESHIEWMVWAVSKGFEAAERDSIKTVLDSWKAGRPTKKRTR